MSDALAYSLFRRHILFTFRGSYFYELTGFLLS